MAITVKHQIEPTVQRSGKVNPLDLPARLAARWRSPRCAILATAVFLVLPRTAIAQSWQADSWDFPLDTRGPDTGAAGVLQADSSDFTLDTRAADSGPAGVLLADSADFTLDTTGPDTSAVGLWGADSSDFTLDTRGIDIGPFGVLQADSGDFTLDTRGADTGAAGALLADSSDFVLDTRGTDTGGGVLLADSPGFELDTRDGLDIGLRVYDGIAAIKIAVEAPGAGGQMASALRVNKGGTNYGVLLVPTNWPDASRIRIQSSTGTKAWKKLP
jgi:hypothetical protein